MADNLRDMRLIRVLGERPAALPDPHPVPIPAGAMLYNGPRMLTGSFLEGLSLAWLGEPIGASGAYYAAVLPDDPDAAEWHALNLAAGAVRVEYVTLDEVRQALRGHYAAELGMTPGEGEAMLAGADEPALWHQYVAAGLHLDEPVAV